MHGISFYSVWKNPYCKISPRTSSPEELQWAAIPNITNKFDFIQIILCNIAKTSNPSKAPASKTAFDLEWSLLEPMDLDALFVKHLRRFLNFSISASFIGFRCWLVDYPDQQTIKTFESNETLLSLFLTL